MTPSPTAFDRPHALHIVGIELRTHNGEAFQTVPPHWERFQSQAIAERVPQRLTGDIYAIYTHFEQAGRSSDGLYSLVLGVATPANAEPPPGMVRTTVPAGPYAAFLVPDGRFDQVGPTWQAVWQRRDLQRLHIAEYEHYHADGRIEILVGLRTGAAV